MSNHLTEAQLFDWGWRVPFLASAALVLVGLYVRLQLVETAAFQRSVVRGERVRVPFAVVVVKYSGRLVLGTLAATTTFVVFYLMTVFALGWATGSLEFGRQQFLIFQMAGVVFFGVGIPISAILADRIGERAMLMIATVLIIAFGFAFRPLFSAHSESRILVFLVLGFSLTGLTYGPLGSALARMFPTAVRYTGTSLAFNLAGILGASLAPSVAAFLASHYGPAYVGYYLSAAGLVTLIALLLIGADDRKLMGER